MTSAAEGSPDFSNRTLYEEKNDALRYTWASWLIIVLFPSLFGNVTILVASLKYRAIKLHSVIVMFIEHIAWLDLILTVSCLVPKAVSLTLNEWVFGKVPCYFIVFVTYYGHCAKLQYIGAQTTCKWLILNYPLRTKNWFENRIHVGIWAVIWVFSCGFPIAFLVIDREDMLFDYRTYLCAYRYSSPAWRWLQIVFSGTLGLIPITIIIITSALLVTHLLKAKRSAERSRGSFRWQGLVTVLMTAALYILSYVPFASYVVVEAVAELTQSSVTSSAYILYYRVAKESMWFSVMYNVFIYSFTVKSFRDYLKGEVRQRLSTVSLSGNGIFIKE